jgi:hypothetical protein
LGSSSLLSSFSRRFETSLSGFPGPLAQSFVEANLTQRFAVNASQPHFLSLDTSYFLPLVISILIVRPQPRIQVSVTLSTRAAGLVRRLLNQHTYDISRHQHILPAKRKARPSTFLHRRNCDLTDHDVSLSPSHPAYTQQAIGNRHYGNCRTVAWVRWSTNVDSVNHQPVWTDRTTTAATTRRRTSTAGCCRP